MTIIETELKRVPQKEHRDGCPGDRFETYPVRRADGSEAAVVRCIDCGGQAIYEKGDEHVH